MAQIKKRFIEGLSELESIVSNLQGQGQSDNSEELLKMQAEKFFGEEHSAKLAEEDAREKEGLFDPDKMTDRNPSKEMAVNP